MRVEAHNLFKRYTHSFIIKDFSFQFESGQKYGVKGRNGSGKSTLMKILSGYLSPSKGEVKYFNKDGETVDRSNVFQYISYMAPYIETDLELTPKENFEHLRNFKTFSFQNVEELLDAARLEGNRDKQVKNFSDGMKQRFGLSLALCSDAEVVFLDEPTSFLDEPSKKWFAEMIAKYCQQKTLIIASNDSTDFNSVNKIISIETKPD